MNRITALPRKKLIAAIVFFPIVGWLGLSIFITLVDDCYFKMSRPKVASVFFQPDQIKGSTRAEVIKYLGTPDMEDGPAFFYADRGLFNINRGAIIISFDKNNGTVNEMRYDTSGI